MAYSIINSLRIGGEAGLIHLGALSNVIERPISVLDQNGLLKYIIGNNAEVKPVAAQYFGPTFTNLQGHWTLPGGKDPIKYRGGRNDCLFTVIAEQVDVDPSYLRQLTANAMDDEMLASLAMDYMWLYNSNRDVLCLGGAKYTGSSAADARSILEKSQGVAGQAYSAQGHPRGHSSNPALPRVPHAIDCIENYSYSGRKSGFDSTYDQDEITHLVLSTPQAQAAMRQLNSGSTREVAAIPYSSLNCPSYVGSGGWWSNGVKEGGGYAARTIVAVLQHHRGRCGDSDDVHVHTLYPKSY